MVTLFHMKSVIAFTRNAKSSAIGCVIGNWLYWILPYPVSGRTESVLQIYYWLLLIMHVASTEEILLDSLKSVCLRFVIRSACGLWHSICFSLSKVTSINWIRKIRQKLGNKMENERRLNNQKREKSIW